MDAKVGRDIAHVDIPGAFLQTKVSDGTILKLQGPMVLAVVKMNPEWKKYIFHEGKRRTPTVYSEAIKILYGMVDAAKLFFDNLQSFLQDELNFIPNPYDVCVMNKDVDGE